MIVANDNDGRFIVHQGTNHHGFINRTRWYVYDGEPIGLPITIGFMSEAEATRHRDQIAVLYERYGW